MELFTALSPHTGAPQESVMHGQSDANQRLPSQLQSTATSPWAVLISCHAELAWVAGYIIYQDGTLANGHHQY